MATVNRPAIAARMALVALPVSVALAGLGLGNAQPVAVVGHQTAEQPALAASNVVGTWSANVSTSIPSSGTVTYVFRPDGTMTVTAGTASVTGTWQADNGNHFTFVIDNPLTDSNGNTVGQRHAEQDSTLHGENSFTSTGTTVDSDLEGNEVRTFQVNISATRIGS